MTLRVLIEGAQPTSAQLRVLLLRASTTDKQLDLVVTSSGALEWLTSAVDASGCRASVAALSDAPEWKRYHVLLPRPETSPACILEGLKAGVCVIPPEAPVWTEAEWEDLDRGWRDNPNAGFYAKLFPEPIYVAGPARLDLRLGATINPRAIILNSGTAPDEGWVRIGRASHLGADCLLNLGPTSFTVGKFTMISANFSAHAMRHSLTHISNFCIRRGPFAFFGALNDQVLPITIGNDVWIGERVTALAGVEVADGCVVGAGSVVTRSTQPYGVYAGSPARLIRYRFDSQKIELLRASAWWDWDYDRLVRVQEQFRRRIDLMSTDELRELLAMSRAEPALSRRGKSRDAGH